MRNLLTVLAPLFLFFSCNTADPNDKAVEYNGQAMKIFNAFSRQMVEGRAELFKTDLPAGKAEDVVRQLDDSLKSYIALTEALPRPEEADSLHNSIMAIYTFQRDSVLPLLDRTTRLPAGSAQWNDVWRELHDIDGRLMPMLAEVHILQHNLEKEGEWGAQ